MVTKSAVIGIDIGSNESLVAFVGKGVVDIVQNEVSKRSTPSLVGFTDRERLLGDTALSQIRSNAKNTCRNFKHLLGRPVDAPDLQKEHFWSTSKLATGDDTFAGYDVNYKGEPRVFSAPQVTAMFLTKLKEITEKWCQAKVADAVISVPSYVSDVHRQALLDAAKIAGISVLRLMNEHTATALAYGIYRSNDFDETKPLNVAFASMGHSLFSVSIVQFVKGKLTVVCEKSDKVGGRDMDECLMRAFAAQFEKKHGCDPLSNKKSAFKLEDAVTKTKKILSANNEAGVNVECLMEDYDFSSNMNRADFEEMCKPMMDRVKAVLDSAIAMAPMGVEGIDSIEIVGGASRVPFVKKLVSEAFGGKELCTTMNADESVCRGCALQAAILSPLYKVRDFKVEDASPFTINVGWMGSSADAEAKKEEDGDEDMGGAEGEYKTATVFPAGSAMNVVKMLTFYRKGPFDVKAEYGGDVALLPGTPKELGTYKIELPAQTEPKKVKVKAKLSLHGVFQLESAQMVEEEEYDETVKEKRELPEEEPSPVAEATTEAAEAPKDGDEPMTDGTKEEWKEDEKKEEKKEEKKKEPKYEWVDVVKKKKRTKKTDLNVTAAGKPGLSETVLQKRMDEETAMQAEMREIIDLDEKRNDLEGYIFNMRDKIAESGAYGAFVSSGDRDKFNSDLMKAEDWLYDNEGATKAQYIEKLTELKSFGDQVVWRSKEDGMRGEWITAVSGTIKNYKTAAENPGDKYGHIAADRLGKIIAACNELEKWLTDMQAKQEKMPKFDRPVLICGDMEKKNQELAKLADDILKEPKPAPPPKPEPKKEEEKPPAEEKKAEEPPKEEEAKEESKPADGPANMDVD
mmetsp:Transcript_41316/g.75448  ORF Transcript_41316/g.75448 Transcript_41316/m.75448 type:complete len:856 (-) Transcript_41316:158-2725(-)